MTASVIGAPVAGLGSWEFRRCRGNGSTACTVRGLIDGHTEASGHSYPGHRDETASRHSPREGQGDRCTGSGYARASPAHERAGNHAAHGSRGSLGGQCVRVPRPP